MIIPIINQDGLTTVFYVYNGDIYIDKTVSYKWIEALGHCCAGSLVINNWPRWPGFGTNRFNFNSVYSIYSIVSHADLK